MPLQKLGESTYTFSATGDSWVTLNTTSPSTTIGYLQVWIDVSNMASGDVLELQILEAIKNGGTQRTVHKQVVSGLVASPVLVTPAYLLWNSWDVQIRQRNGTARSFDWSLRMA